jgi:hypothetical protein
MEFKLDEYMNEVNFYGTFFRLLGFTHNKFLSNPENINRKSCVVKKNRCAKPTIRKKDTVNIVGENGEKVSFDILDPNYLDMQNGHKFITGVVYEKRGQ